MISRTRLADFGITHSYLPTVAADIKTIKLHNASPPLPVMHHTFNYRVWMQTKRGVYDIYNTDEESKRALYDLFKYIFIYCRL